MTCPICGVALKVIGDLSEDGVESCPNGHYGYEHSYGSHRAHYDVDGSGYICLNQTWHYSEEDAVSRLRDAASKAFSTTPGRSARSPRNSCRSDGKRS